ncbi:MAG: CapA family protein [Acidimicrobiia bacterium]
MIVVAGGDVLNERLLNDAGAAFAAPGERYDFAPVFAPVAPIVTQADLAICHLELPVGRPDESAGVRGRSTMGGNLLLAPYEIAEGLATIGFDRCSTASNHSFDLGSDGIVSTLDALDEAGLGHDGTARSAEEAEIGTTTVITVNGIRVAHLSYTTFWNTDPPADRWMLRRASAPEQIAADVTTARAAGAEVVLVSMHLAKEMLREPLAGDRQFVMELTALTRVDLIVHHGPHVVQPVEWVNDTVVYWSVGNFVSGMGVPGTGKYEDPRTLDGLLARVRFTETASGRFTAEPEPIAICNERRTRTVYPPVAALAADAALQHLPDQLRGELHACADRISAIVGEIR